MSRILLKHKPTGSKIPITALNYGLQRFIISKPTLIGSRNYEYTYSNLLHHPDWSLEDWDYRERFSFKELQIIYNALDAAVMRGELNASDPLLDKCNKLIGVEYERINGESRYTEYTYKTEDGEDI